MKQQLASWYKQLVGSLEYSARGLSYEKDELVVLCMHSTPKSWMDEFGRILSFLTQHFKVLNATELEDYYKGNKKDGPYVLFTFDDGLRNNMYVAQYLAEKEISAYFFIVPDFAEATNSMEYYLRFIRPVTDPNFDRLSEDMQSLRYNEIMELIGLGHKIGSHSATHTMHLELTEEQLQVEVCESKQRLSKNLEIGIDAFCSTNNTALTINTHAKKRIAENYHYHFTTFPGLNAVAKNRQLILRRNIEVNWPLGKIKYSLGRVDLNRWTPIIDRFLSL